LTVTSFMKWWIMPMQSKNLIGAESADLKH
jgi:hypothetical protein